MKKSIPRQEGQGLVEYALILVLVAVVVIGILLVLGPQIRQVFARVALELQYPGQFGGPPVYVQSINVTANAGCNPISGVCNGVAGTATVSLVDDGGNSVSGEAYVQFTNNGDGTTVTRFGTGSIDSDNLGGGSPGDSVEACVIGVTDYSLAGGYGGASVCDSDTYD
jgi:pilus assembly protein Flp/PilA